MTKVGSRWAGSLDSLALDEKLTNSERGMLLWLVYHEGEVNILDASQDDIESLMQLDMKGYIDIDPAAGEELVQRAFEIMRSLNEDMGDPKERNILTERINEVEQLGKTLRGLMTDAQS